MIAELEGLATVALQLLSTHKSQLQLAKGKSTTGTLKATTRETISKEVKNLTVASY